MTATHPRLSRVVLAYAEENFDRAVADFSRALGLQFDMLPADHLGLRVAMALEAGVEIIAPIGDVGHGPTVREELAKRGEGLMQFILEVSDLEASAAQAADAGFDSAGFRIDCFEANPAWRETWAVMREAPLPLIHNAAVTLIEFKPQGGQ